MRFSRNKILFGKDFKKLQKANIIILGVGGVGKNKVAHLQSIYPKVNIIDQKINSTWINDFNMDKYDLILDAIDDIDSKVQLIQKYYKKLISTTGSAKRIDPTKIEYIDIYKTYNDPFIKKIKHKLIKEGFTKKFKVIFSKEEVQCQDMGSFIGVTATFGLTMCAIAIKKIRLL
ncbi:MoeB/thiF family protein [hydrothermal vent metagenome]|uniref:MoeB/thiF family protein n=1 Tax=hydrothermal vent metagenome TaxID=652676 RepID=A0A3B1E9F7_9ZZZZ